MRVLEIVGYILIIGIVAMPVIALVNEIRMKRSSRPKI